MREIEPNVFAYDVGDRVILQYDNPDDNPDLHNGDTGTVCADDPGDYSEWVSVRWDNEIEGGHTCEGTCDDGHGWNVGREYLSPYKEAEINEADIACIAEIFSLIGV